MSDISMGLDRLKPSMLGIWTAGDFSAVSKEIGVAEAEEFAAGIVFEPGTRVLDIACGTGNITMPLARRGARVTGLDMTLSHLMEARARADNEDLHICFDEGFAEMLPYADSRFDLVVSMFGIMFSPMPETVVSEMARVLRPNGRLALAAWTQSGFGGDIGTIVSGYLPPPPAATSPFRWADQATARRRLKPAFDNIEASVVPVIWELQRNPAKAAAFFAQNSVVIQLMLGRLDPPQRAAFSRDFERLWTEANSAIEGAEHTIIRNEYLKLTAVRC